MCGQCSIIFSVPSSVVTEPISIFRPYIGRIAENNLPEMCIRDRADTDSLPVEGGGLHFIVAGFRITGISGAGKDEGGR